MFVLIEGKIFNSDDVPVMILFTPSEIESFKSQPRNVDIHCSFPPEWPRDKGKQWMEAKRNKLIKARNDDLSRATKRRMKLPVISPRVISDEEIKKMFVEADRKENPFHIPPISSGSAMIPSSSAESQSSSSNTQSSWESRSSSSEDGSLL